MHKHYGCQLPSLKGIETPLPGSLTLNGQAKAGAYLRGLESSSRRSELCWRQWNKNLANKETLIGQHPSSTEAACTEAACTYPAHIQHRGGMHISSTERHAHPRLRTLRAATHLKVVDNMLLGVQAHHACQQV